MNTVLSKSRNLNFLLIAALVGMLIVTLAVISSATVPSSATTDNQLGLAEKEVHTTFKPLSADAFPQYQRSEWTYVPIIVNLEEALAAYHRSEWASVATPEMGVNGLDVYHQSERTLVTLGLDKNDPFYRYHLSEWFGR